MAMITPINSAIPGIGWPAIPTTRAAAVLSLLFQLDQSQWWPANILRQHQFRQLRLMLDHAYSTVPFYRERLDSAGLRPAATPDAWPRVPLLTRRDIQLAGPRLHSTALPTTHGRPNRKFTGGSTGEPVMTLGTAVRHCDPPLTPRARRGRLACPRSETGG